MVFPYRRRPASGFKGRVEAGLKGLGIAGD